MQVQEWKSLDDVIWKQIFIINSHSLALAWEENRPANLSMLDLMTIQPLPVVDGHCISWVLKPCNIPARFNTTTWFGCHVDTMNLLSADPSPRKKSGFATSKAVATRVLRLLGIFLWNLEKTSKIYMRKQQDVSYWEIWRRIFNLKNSLLCLPEKKSLLPWAKGYMKTDTKIVMFPDKMRATLKGPTEGEGKGWVANGNSVTNVFVVSKASWFRKA